VQPTGVPAITSSSQTSETHPASPASSLFLVDATGRSEHRFTLFDLENKILRSQNVDFSTTTWDVTLGSSRFSSLNGSEFIHYNPSTKEIIFVLFPSPSGIGGLKPADALPDPPFRFAIYKTSFESQNQFTPLYIETASKIVIEHMVLNPQNNSLFADVDTDGEVRHPEILRFDISASRFEHIANTETSFSGKDLLERSDLRLSSDGQKLYQLVLYGTPQEWADETLYLETINLDDRSVKYQEIIAGDNIQYDILALSADGNRIAYYTMEAGQYSLWVKDLGSESVQSIPISGDIGNFNLFMPNDGKKILVGKKDTALNDVRYYWEIYDLDSNEYQAMPLDQPLAWDSSGRYLAGIKDNSYIIYDIEALSELEIGLSVPADFAGESVQWH
jgi:hypothetical protein